MNSKQYLRRLVCRVVASSFGLAHLQAARDRFRSLQHSDQMTLTSKQPRYDAYTKLMLSSKGANTWQARWRSRRAATGRPATKRQDLRPDLLPSVLRDGRERLGSILGNPLSVMRRTSYCRMRVHTYQEILLRGRIQSCGEDFLRQGLCDIAD